jgi:hypothetical protein
MDAWKDRPQAAVDGAMKFRDTPEMSAKPGRKIARSPKQAEPRLDEWFTKRLHDLYDPVLEEQIPEDLSRLLEDFAKRPAAKPERAGPDPGEPEQGGNDRGAGE